MNLFKSGVTLLTLLTLFLILSWSISDNDNGSGSIVDSGSDRSNSQISPYKLDNFDAKVNQHLFFKNQKQILGTIKREKQKKGWPLMTKTVLERRKKSFEDELPQDELPQDELPQNSRNIKNSKKSLRFLEKKLKNLEQKPKLTSFGAESFRMGDLLILTPSKDFMLEIDESIGVKRIYEIIFENSKFEINKNHLEKISSGSNGFSGSNEFSGFNGSFATFRDTRSLFGANSRLGIIDHHYVVSVDYSHRLVCLEEILFEKGAERPSSYIEKGRCANIVRATPLKSLREDFLTKWHPFISDGIRNFSLTDLRSAFGHHVSLEVIRCSDENISAANKICPQQIISNRQKPQKKVVASSRKHTSKTIYSSIQ